MNKLLITNATLFVVLNLAGQLATAQSIQLENQVWNSEVIRTQGQPIIPLFDGWFGNEDGTRTLCYSYFNMNTKQSLDIPLGKNNYLSDDRFDVMLPTHFDPLPPKYRHKFCVFVVTVPADFSTRDKIYWHLTSADQPLKVPGHVLPAYVLDEPGSGGRGDIAPWVRLMERGERVRGRKGIESTMLHAVAGEPLELTAWIEHPDPEVWVNWTKHSGPSSVSFDEGEEAEELVETEAGMSTTSVMFEAPGAYIVRMQTIDDTSAFEFYCCHTNAYFHINVSE